MYALTTALRVPGGVPAFGVVVGVGVVVMVVVVVVVGGGGGGGGGAIAGGRHPGARQGAWD